MIIIEILSGARAVASRSQGRAGPDSSVSRDGIGIRRFYHCEKLSSLSITHSSSSLTSYIIFLPFIEFILFPVFLVRPLQEKHGWSRLHNRWKQINLDCNAYNYKTNFPQTVRRSSAQTVRKRSWWARRLSFAHFFQIQTIISNCVHANDGPAGKVPDGISIWCFFSTVPKICPQA